MATKLVATNPVVTIATIDVSDEVASVACPINAESLDATVANSAGWMEVEGGRNSATLDIEAVFLDDMSTGLWDVLNDNYNTKVAFTFKLKNAAIATTNPEFQGFVHINQRPFGGAVNQLHTASLSLPVSGTITIDVVP